MNRMEIDKCTLKSGANKYISEPDDDGYIFKFFKSDGKYTPYSFEKQDNIIKMKKQYIGKFIPETELIKNEDGSYYIKQKYIEGKLLKYMDINQLDKETLSDLLELFNGYIAFCKNEGMEMDVFGYQQDINNVENIRKRRFLTYTRMFNSFLSSTNIMISNDNKVYMIDVCDSIPLKKGNKKLYKIKHAVRQAIIELGIKKTKYKINRIIEKKRNELLDAFQLHCIS